MRCFFALALLLTAFSAQTEIYRGVDKEGNVFYSDVEQPNAELIPTPTPNTIPMPKPKPKKPVELEKKVSLYTSFSIVSPTSNATIRNSTGNVSINLSVQPSLDTKQGHRIAIYLDGEVLVSASTKLKIQLPNISQGKHTLSAEVMNEEGNQLISSNSVDIHMKRGASQHGKSTGTSPGPHNSQGNPYTPGPVIPSSNP